MSMKQLLFSFRGRLNRKRYWMTVIVTMAVIILLLLLALVMMREQRFEFAVLTVVILLLLYIPLIWIGLAIGAKRLHDRDKPRPVEQPDVKRVSSARVIDAITYRRLKPAPE